VNSNRFGLQDFDVFRRVAVAELDCVSHTRDVPRDRHASSHDASFAILCDRPLGCRRSSDSCCATLAKLGSGAGDGRTASYTLSLDGGFVYAAGTTLGNTGISSSSCRITSCT